MEPAGGKKCQSDITWCSVHCLKAGKQWWFEKVMLGGRTLRNITVTGILIEGSFTTESFKGVMCNINWLLSLTSRSPKTDILGYRLFEPCDHWHFLDMLMSLKQHNSWFGVFNIENIYTVSCPDFAETLFKIIIVIKVICLVLCFAQSCCKILKKWDLWLY